MSQRHLPTQLQKLPNSRKGNQLNFKLRKPRIESNLKEKCAIIDEAKRRGFKPESVERTLNRVNQTQLADEFGVRNHQQDTLESQRSEAEIS